MKGWCHKNILAPPPSKKRGGVIILMSPPHMKGWCHRLCPPPPPPLKKGEVSLSCSSPPPPSQRRGGVIIPIPHLKEEVSLSHSPPQMGGVIILSPLPPSKKGRHHYPVAPKHSDLLLACPYKCSSG